MLLFWQHQKGLSAWVCSAVNRLLFRIVRIVYVDNGAIMWLVFTSQGCSVTIDYSAASTRCLHENGNEYWIEKLKITEFFHPSCEERRSYSKARRPFQSDSPHPLSPSVGCLVVSLIFSFVPTEGSRCHGNITLEFSTWSSAAIISSSLVFFETSLMCFFRTWIIFFFLRC